MYEFKYRIDDPKIGRFWQVDPLANKYTYNSTYAFSENKIINAIELEGLESKDVQRRIALTPGAATTTTSGEERIQKIKRKRISQEIARNSKGQMVDPNTGKVLNEDETDIGHKPDEEWKVRKVMHKKKGSTRQQVIEEENNSDLYHIEDRNEIEGHKHEEKRK
jgi:hypothetical protein